MNQYYISHGPSGASIEPILEPSEWDEDEWLARIEHKEDVKRDEQDAYQDTERND